MEISSYEKQILLYGRHCRDPAGCGVWGADGVDVDYELGESLYVTFGGGWMGQTDAMVLGIARALEKVNAEWRIPLKKAGLLTRDSRIRERKKPGRPGARKRFQFSKR